MNDIEWRGSTGTVQGPMIYGTRNGSEASHFVMFDMTAQDILDAADCVIDRLDELDDAPRKIESELSDAEDVADSVRRVAAKLRAELRSLYKISTRIKEVEGRPEIESIRHQALVEVRELNSKVWRALEALGDLGRSEDEDDDE